MEGATVILPFHQLRQYRARGTWHSHLNALRSGSNLVECALAVDNIFPPPITKIALPHLLRLSLSKSNLLEYLDTPSLQELYCSSRSDHLSSLLKRQPYRLQKLVLFFPASVTDLTGILHAIPTLTNIGLSIPPEATDALSTLLMVRDEPTDVGLDLRSITVCFQRSEISLYNFGDGGLLVDMVESRWRGRYLRSITIPNALIPCRDERLERFKNEGLEVKLASSFSKSHLDMVPPHLRLEIDNL
ncbi:hypothetical protein DFH09DRAFT_1436910 [Mycena vulgaris]|nr:hypothetical protein DFH09DRAFT_1436910 [Mycena vulgaris]